MADQLYVKLILLRPVPHSPQKPTGAFSLRAHFAKETQAPGARAADATLQNGICETDVLTCLHVAFGGAKGDVWRLAWHSRSYITVACST